MLLKWLSSDKATNLLTLTPSAGSTVGRGIINIDELSKINSFILDEFYVKKLSLLGIYYCTDHPDNATDFRKPGVGMFDKASKDNNIDLKRSIMIGDAVSDIEPGVKLGMEQSSHHQKKR